MSDDVVVPRHPPKNVDLSKPSAARMYDYFLGGTANWAIDQQAGKRAIELLPWVRDMARANRAFLRRTVHFCLENGINQFVDIGSGIPTVGNVHHVADSLDLESRVVYVDNEPIAVAHGRLDLEKDGDERRHQIIEADLRDEKYLWSQVLDTGVIDPSRPIALLAVAVLHFVPDEEDPHAAMRYYRDQVPSGSALVLSHGTLDKVTPEQQARLDEYTRHYGKTQNPLLWRSSTELSAFLGDFDVVDPGVVFLPEWRPNPQIAPELDTQFLEPSQSLVYGVVGRKP